MINNNYHKLKAILENLPCGIYVKDIENKIIYVNKIFLKNFNLNYDEVMYNDEKTILRQLNIDEYINDETMIIKEKKTLSVEKKINNGNKQVIYEISKSPMFNNKNEVIGIILLYYDITCMKNIQNELEKLAYTDYLTNLLNRRGLFKYLFSKFTNTNNKITLLFIDLDNFKKLNDTFGHKYGDEALKMIAKRLSEFCGCNVARVGGDEFVVIYENIDDKTIKFNASQILSLLQLKFKKNNKEIFISGSIGIITEYCENINYSELLSKGDICLYKAKANGKNQFVFYDENF